MKRVITLLAVAVWLVSATAFAKEGHGHDRHQKDAAAGHHADPQMAKLHKMMPKYAKAEARINAALESGELKLIAKETEYLLSTTTDLKKARPHRNRAELEEFKGIAAGFEQDVKSTAEFARKDDRAGAKAAFASARKRCGVCHAKFRDPS